jgi:hypothetical protein
MGIATVVSTNLCGWALAVLCSQATKTRLHKPFIGPFWDSPLGPTDGQSRGLEDGLYPSTTVNVVMCSNVLYIAATGMTSPAHVRIVCR